MTIREESPEDVPEICRVLDQAFGQEGESRLVEELRLRSAITLSLVAIQENQVVGHILFSPATIVSEDTSFDALGLGPMAVLPEHQNKGVGSELVRAGLRRCADAGHEIVVVLGHPEYYPKFGFKIGNLLGIRCEFDVPDEAFMVTELREGALTGRTGVVRYQLEFNNV
ncbi:MAG: GNAT family N-acetyltransferase [Planctomyces sp.]|nr:GNAT family N-acetyltransferase [Planctomyces sp.]